MDAPFGILFLKKAELYNLACRLDKQYDDSQTTSKNLPLWPIEKQILKWTYRHHKHLGSPIDTNHLSRDPKWSKLKDFNMLNTDGSYKREFSYLENGQLDKPLENLVVRGFAQYFDQAHGHSAIIIDKEGLLLGEVLADLEGNFFMKINYLIYSKIMDHLGASLLLIITLWWLLKFFGVLQ